MESVSAFPPSVQIGIYVDVPDPDKFPALVVENDTSVGVMVIAIPVEAVKVLYCNAVPVISEERKAFTYEMVDLPVPPPKTLKIPLFELVKL
jgi:hypothetical protein